MSDHPGPPAWVTTRLAQLVGIRQLDLEDPLHKELALDVYELGTQATDGAVLQRLRWRFAWQLKRSGEQLAQSRLAYERHVDRRTVELRAGEKPPSRAEAEQIARAEDAAYQSRLDYLLAEQRERAMRKFLDAVESAIDLHRTERADARAADRAHAGGYGGGA